MAATDLQTVKVASALSRASTAVSGRRAAGRRERRLLARPSHQHGAGAQPWMNRLSK
jgi:hypothetical protein